MEIIFHEEFNLTDFCCFKIKPFDQSKAESFLKRNLKLNCSNDEITKLAYVLNVKKQLLPIYLVTLASFLNESQAIPLRETISELEKRNNCIDYVLDYVSKVHKEPFELLKVAAYLDGHFINLKFLNKVRDMMSKFGKEDEDSSDKNAIINNLEFEPLIKLSLIEVRNNNEVEKGIFIHDLIQCRTKEFLKRFAEFNELEFFKCLFESIVLGIKSNSFYYMEIESVSHLIYSIENNKKVFSTLDKSHLESILRSFHEIST